MTLLAVAGLVKRYGAVIAVDRVDFTVAAGQRVALIGPNGAGKTSCFNALGGQAKPDAGSVHLAGRDITGKSAHAICQFGLGRTFQIAAVFRSMTVRENVQVALLSRHRRLWSSVTRADRFRIAEADALLDRVGLGAAAGLPAERLAYSDLKRLELAMTLARQPSLLLMDEPTAGIAAGERRALMTLVDTLAADRRLGVLFTEHDMDIVFGHADRVLVLDRGRLIAEGTPEAVRADARVRDVYLGPVKGGA
jgi:branched-chain amino acid transport system ATP-binding protein